MYGMATRRNTLACMLVSSSGRWEGRGRREGKTFYLAVLVRFASEDIGAGLELGDAEAELGVAGVEWVDFVCFGVGVARLKIVGGGEGCEGEEGEEGRVELHVCWFGRWWSAQPVEFALKRWWGTLGANGDGCLDVWEDGS